MAAIAIVTGSGGLIGSESVRHLVAQGLDVVGIENDMRSRFFGPEASTAPVTEELKAAHPEFHSHELDIRDAAGVERLFARHAGSIEVVVHTAAQPSHDWAAREPQTDFGVNANGTLNLLEAARAHCPDAPFIFCSTNKVYGDTPNRLPLEDLPTRLELPESHPYFKGIDTSMSIDLSTHSLFGASKAAADLLVQEYGRYFDMPTVCFRGGCLTGPQHAGAKLHGFLAYLMKCVVTGTPYTIFGYAGKQVRDNIHSADLVAAFEAYRDGPAGGGRLQHRRRALLELLDARGDLVLRADRGPRARVGARARAADRRSPLVDLRPLPVRGRLPGLVAAPRDRGDPDRDLRAEPRALDGDRRLVGCDRRSCCCLS